MNQLRRSTHIGCEDLMREISAIEQELLKENNPLAMELMVLETKIRERIQLIQSQPGQRQELPIFSDDLTMEEIQAMIPQDYGPFPTLKEIEEAEKKKRIIQNVIWAAVLAVFTALGVFGLASIIQMTLSWIA